jgi:hypothetical protein
MPSRRTKRRQPPRKRPAAPAPGPAQAQARPQSPQVGAQAAVKAVELSLAPKQAGRARTGRNVVLVQDADPGIPLEQVPYFTSDLTRLGVVALAMVVLMVIGAQFIPLLVK